MKHSTLPFSLFYRKGRKFYQVKFRNESGKYLPAISTGQETKAGAMAVAFQWLKDGIPKKAGPVSLAVVTMLDSFQNVSQADTEHICQELQRRGLLDAFTVAKSRAAVSFTVFLSNFWSWDSSPYIREKLRKNHGIHKNYTQSQKLTVDQYWIPFFQGRILGDVCRADIEKFVDSLDGLKLSAARKNGIIQAGTIPLKWAYTKEMTSKDVTMGITKFAGKSRERHILTPELAGAIFKTAWDDDRVRLANFLAATTGLRCGEIQALRVQDLGKDCLYISHSWNCRDGLKTTKNNKARTVEVFPEIITELANIAKENPHGASLDSYIFWGERKANKPIEERLLLAGLRQALQDIGMSQETAKEYVFHSWRHTYASYMRKRLDTRLLQSQTGHKTMAMLEHYSDHALEDDREVIQGAQRAAFSNLIPFAAGA